MTEEKISIIIPVYKVEEYLETCLDSVLAQTYQNLEILLVDDGSPDRCGEICDRYAQKDKRIRVIHKKNEGVARARNTALELASGDYISFMDSDDWIAPKAYEILYRGLKKYDADCSVGDCTRAYEKDGMLFFEKKEKQKEAECIEAKEVIGKLLLQGSAIWNRLFKRKLFEKIRFPQGRINDDEVTALHVLAECRKIVYVNQETYYYRIRANSITTAAFSLKKLDFYYNAKENRRFIREKLPELLGQAEYKYVKAMLYCYVNLGRLGGQQEADRMRAALKKELRQNKVQALENPFLDWKYKILLQICTL